MTILTTLAAQLTAAGITAPSYNDILASLQESFRGIYGSDSYLGADSQDGQLLAIFAQAIHDANQTMIMVYNNMSPSTAQGVGLSSVIKINNMKRGEATHSQVNVNLTGVAGTIIVDGVIGDANGNRWLLPAVVTIGLGSTVTVTATAEKAGAIQALSDTVTQILTPTSGWATVTNPAAAVSGTEAESDAQVRARQNLLPALNSTTTTAGLIAALRNLPGVTYGTVYENDTGAVNTLGIPAHSIAAVIKGGDATAIATTIFNKKNQGVGTYGTTTVNLTDLAGTDRPINFTVPTEVTINVEVNLTALLGYTSAIGTAIKQAITDYINGLDIGASVIITNLFVPALLSGALDSKTYKLTSIRISAAPAALGTSDVPISFIQKAISAIANVTINVT